MGPSKKWCICKLLFQCQVMMNEKCQKTLNIELHITTEEYETIAVVKWKCVLWFFVKWHDWGLQGVSSFSECTRKSQNLFKHLDNFDALSHCQCSLWVWIVWCFFIAVHLFVSSHSMSWEASEKKLRLSVFNLLFNQHQHQWHFYMSAWIHYNLNTGLSHHQSDNNFTSFIKLMFF